jgi:hypothetical protein
MKHEYYDQHFLCWLGNMMHFMWQWFARNSELNFYYNYVIIFVNAIQMLKISHFLGQNA